MTLSRAYPLLWLLFLLATGGRTVAAGAQPVSSSMAISTTDAALFTPLATLDRNLERLRRFVGAPKARSLDIGIHSSLPRDLYFLALTLWQKTDRLAFEITRARATPPPAPTGDIKIQDIPPIMEDAQRILQQVMRELRIAGETEPTSTSGKTDIFTALIALNRQMDVLLERHFGPSDVYMEATLAIGYAARLLARYPDATRIPEEPPFEPDKQPSDIYLRLIECLRGIAQIFHALELDILEIDTRPTDIDSLTPNDVFMTASLVVSQLDHLHKHLGIDKPPPQTFYPGRKFPAHNYQRIGILQAQLAQLRQLITTQQTAVGKSNHESAIQAR